MIKYPCPVCGKRACDSNKMLSITKLTNGNEANADIIIKCRVCKNALVIKVSEQTLDINTTLNQRQQQEYI